MTPSDSTSSTRSGHRPQTAQRARIQAAVIWAPTSMAGFGGRKAAAPRARNSHSLKVRHASVAARMISVMWSAPRRLRPMRRRAKAVVAQGADRDVREVWEHADFLGLVDFQNVSPPRRRVSSAGRVAQ